MSCRNLRDKSIIGKASVISTQAVAFRAEEKDVFASLLQGRKKFSFRGRSHPLAWPHMSDMTQDPSPFAGVSLRQRTGADLASLAELWVASWQEAMPEIDFSARRTWFLDRLNELEIAGAVTICAFDTSNQLLGFVNFDPASGYLDQIAVAPDAKGSGAARLLLAEARRLSQGGVTLEVNQDNPRALRFYEREGFEKFGEAVNPISGLKTWRLRLAKNTSAS